MADPYRYIDLNDSNFEFVGRVTGAAEAALEAVANIEVGPINYLAQTMWKSVRTQINGVDVSPNDSMYAYKAFVSHVITTTKSANENSAKIFEAWDVDRPAAHYGAVAKGNNLGLAGRITKFCNNTDVRLFIRPVDAIWCHERALPHGFSLKIQFERQPETYTMMGDGAHPAAPELHVRRAIMHLKTGQVAREHAEAHKEALDSQGGIIMDLKIAGARVIEVPQGMTSYNISNVYNGTLPA